MYPGCGCTDLGDANTYCSDGYNDHGDICSQNSGYVFTDPGDRHIDSGVKCTDPCDRY